MVHKTSSECFNQNKKREERWDETKGQIWNILRDWFTFKSKIHLKGIAQPKYTHPHFIPNLHGFLSSVENREKRYFKECWVPNKTGPHWLSLYSVFQTCLHIYWSKTVEQILLCVSSYFSYPDTHTICLWRSTGSVKDTVKPSVLNVKPKEQNTMDS